MNKKFIIILTFLFAFLFAYVFKNEIIEASLYVNKFLVEIKNNISNKINSHFNQAKKIEILIKENKNLENKINDLNAKILACRDLKYFKIINKPNLVFTYTISYASIPDFSQIYISYNKKIDKPKGLVYNNLVAGEVIKNIGNFSLAILNSNKKTRYAVYIGKSEIPGIFYGKIDRVKYIPKFKDVKVGDEVITSGLDGIFYKGAKVGIITEVTEKKLYKEAKVNLYYNNMHPEFFYVIEGGKNGN
ncbi:rod shape-determining protein MreC [Lebetimonas natsushimae]|uniref:Rod shape-determining protein MreC n=1 Tax=Lebetimonas natsushimae TaxID=1936991 RepID=A0A292YBF7_9BACT|nr:rod shape-determining protein MreC [Lebetimonas natsushimae]GAX86735.1 rod shape-determining protein MreC [Lebetimonas natsushimae]